MTRRPFSVATLIIAALVLSACGQLGPLYLPDDHGNVITRPTRTPSPQTSAPAAPESKTPE